MEDQIKGLKINSAGYGTIAKLAMQDKELHIYAKALYAYFCSFTGAGDTCFPGRDKVCADLKISKDSFCKYLKQLTNAGYISVTQCKKENGTFSHNVYTLQDVIVPATVSDLTGHGLTVSGVTVSGATVSGQTDTNNNSSNNNNINNNSINNMSPASSRFYPPTVEEVRSFCQERHNNVDPERFVDYYTSIGWKVGKKPMKDWHAAIRTWEKNSFSSNNRENNCGNNNPDDFNSILDNLE